MLSRRDLVRLVSSCFPKLVFSPTLQGVYRLGFNRSCHLSGALIVICSLLTLMAAAPGLQGQVGDSGTIEGTVINSQTGAGLENVRVRVEGNSLETLTDRNGAFRLSKVSAGDVRLRFSYLGFEDRTETILLESGATLRRDFELSRGASRSSVPVDDVVELGKITIVADREMNAQELALNEQRNAPNLKNVVAFDEYPTARDGNVGEFLKFIPGVALTYSGIHGDQLSLRGFPSANTGISIDGNSIASGDLGGTRSINLLSVPTNNISRVEVTKVPTPDMPANSLGGSVNLITSSALGRRRPLFTYDLYSAFKASYGLTLEKRAGTIPALNKGHIQPSLDLTYLFPVNDRVALTFAASKKINYFQSDEANPTWDLVNNIQRIAVARSTPHLVTLESARVGADFKLSSQDVLSANISTRTRSTYQTPTALSVNYGVNSTGDRYYTQGSTAGVGSLATAFNWVLSKYVTTQTGLKYVHTGDAWKFEVNGSLSRAFNSSNSDKQGFFSNVTSGRNDLIIRGEGINGSGENIASLLPANFIVTDRNRNSFNLYDQNAYPISSAISTDNQGLGRKNEARADLTKEFFTTLRFTLKTGVAIGTNDWTGRSYSRTYSFRPDQAANVRVAGNYGVVDPGFSNHLIPSFAGEKVQWISPRLVYGLYTQHPEYFILDAPLAYRTTTLASKDLRETVSAGYVLGDFKLIDNRLRVVTGVRYERTSDKGAGPLNDPTAPYRKDSKGVLIRDAAGLPILITTDQLQRDQLQYKERGVYKEHVYSSYYPSMNASFQITEALMLRAGYARTLGRPDLSSIIPGITYSSATTVDRTITVVNTGLRPWTANNYDVALETYYIKDGFGSIGVFQKDIKDFFATSVTPASVALLESYGLPTDDLDYNIVTKMNGGNATIRGLELGYRQSLTFLPDWARGLQVFVNLTSMKLGGSQSADFTGFNPETLSWGVNLTRARYAVKFNVQQQGETRRNPVSVDTTNGIPANTFSWQGAKKRYTISGEYRLTRNLAVYGSLTDFDKGGYHDVLKRYSAKTTPDYARYQRIQEWGINAVLGLKGEF